MIDLHIHTNNSDGSDSVIDVLKKAQKHELSYMSIIIITQEVNT